MKSVLVLNATYQPLNIVRFQRAINLLDQGKAVSLDGSGHFIHFNSRPKIEIPYVVLLTYVVKQHKVKPANYSKRGVMVRDNYTCAYCGKKATTIDHVIPQDLGGATTFDNCVACCLSCNSKKANKTLEQLGWKLRKNELKTPSHLSVMLNRAPAGTEQRDAWAEYIYMYEPSLALV